MSVHNGRRRIVALLGITATVIASVALPTTAAHAAPACEVTYAKAWDNGSGFGANITVKNLGDPWTSWTLTYGWPGTQLVTGGWSADWSQTGQNVKATSLSWNGNLGTGASTGIGFNGSYTGANVDPTTFAVNGVACNGAPPINQAPSVSMSSPSNGSSYTSGSAVPLAANASDSDGTIAKVEFYVDGALVNTDTASPYAFSATGLAVGSHTASAKAFDNLGATGTSANVSFTVTGTQQPSIIATPTSATVAEGGTASVNFKLNAAPAANVTVGLARTGDTDITVPASVTLTTANWSTGVSATVSAAQDADNTNGVATITASATGYTSATVAVTEVDDDPVVGRVDNPYAGSGVYVNPQWKANAMAEPGGSRIANQPTAVWFDRISAIHGNGSPTTGTMGLINHLDEAVAQDAANGAARLVFQMVVYNLPGRDCSALASNGELGPTELPKYKAEYIDPIAAILARPAYANLRIVTIIEIDSIPNLVTNVSGRPTAVPNCDVMLANGNYINGVGYALAKLGAVPNVYNYIDAGHHGWLGWDDNFGASAIKIKEAATASGSTVNNVHGFITNTANTSALHEPFIDLNGTIGGQMVRQSKWVDWNRYNDESTFATAFRQRLVTEGFNAGIGMLIDTSRNGWGSCVQAPCPASGLNNRPTAASTSTDLNTNMDQSRIDRRVHKGNWCNQAGAGLGERPQASPAPGIDAYVWVKPPGESDGSSTEIPNNEGKGFDRMCDPTYTGNPRNGNSMSGALGGAPLSGHWFSAQFQQLMANAYPAL